MGERIQRDTPRKPLKPDIANFYPRWKFVSRYCVRRKKEKHKKRKRYWKLSLTINQDETRSCPFFQDYDDEIENGRGRRHSSPGSSRGNPRDYGHHLHPDNLVSRPAQIRSSDTALWDTLYIHSLQCHWKALIVFENERLRCSSIPLMRLQFKQIYFRYKAKLDTQIWWKS